MAGQTERGQMEQLMELQMRSMEMRQHVVKISNQVSEMEREHAVATITLGHLETLPADSVTYRPLGKCFVLEPPTKLAERMKEAAAKNEADAVTKLKLRQQFIDRLKENEKQLEELMDHFEKSSKRQAGAATP
uniref:Prefoldin subunit 1 n=1 Tax=Erythrolobus madagascarensis TaxID=708628 RepID=A0A7S0XIJ1_9RHOD|mmetsp:Transcript_3840/g.8458  ORF Transcript_3840/g.8458 Transcript_3840/m.8458 type:complete len:133 (+) Transcript_3840:30-428(+)